MELEQAATIRLGGSYEALQRSEAFLDIMQWLDDACEALESQLANIPLKQKHLFNDSFQQWQQRKKVVSGIRQKVELHVGQKKQIEEDLKNERTDDLGSSSDTALPGYN